MKTASPAMARWRITRAPLTLSLTLSISLVAAAPSVADTEADAERILTIRHFVERARHERVPASENLRLGERIDVRGRRVAELAGRRYPAGRHRLAWEVGWLSPGIYLTQIRAGAWRDRGKIQILP